MAETKKLDAYLALERMMLELDKEQDPLAERLRDTMDPLWYSLSEEDHAFLNQRLDVSVFSCAPICLPIDSELLQAPLDDDAPLAPVDPLVCAISLWDPAA